MSGPRRERQDPRASPEARLLAGLAALRLDTALAGPLLAHLVQLNRWNAAYSLTAVEDPVEQVARHTLDSLSVLPFLLHAERVLDVGSGAGFPGVPLAIAMPGTAVTLLDSGLKKARFLRHLRRTLPLENIEVVEARAQDWRPAEAFDSIVSRAFASLAEFVGATAHLGSARGRWLAMKGKLDDRELAALPAGFRVENTHALTVPGLAGERHLVVVARG